MTVQVRLFAILRERAGTDRVEVDLPATATVADALRALASLPGLEAVAGGGIRAAVNREYATPETPLRGGDELALIPPVSGGAPDPATDAPVPSTHPTLDLTAGHTVSRDGIHAAVTSARLDHEPLVQMVLSEQAGAVVTFAGYPRDIPALEYEAYAEMAVARIVAILTQARAAHGLVHAAAEHRVGDVRAFEASILIAVSAPHRAAAFDGAREILDRIKTEAPIWKVEVAADGTRMRPEHPQAPR